ncbi:uncharacterized protein LOC126734300 [Anthonomus grandis grandis]|uniref:uncharacterized protein LOC126734300 n=1 Tax=Anthonomus grandis grandis TaxID=2921223 RepID=UPI002164FDB4|nr:uncharacterized protein LOC126734300 [Anthonomus grandis grandis]
MWKRIRLLRHFSLTYISGTLLLIINAVNSAGDLWPLDRPEGMPSIQSLEVMCGKDHMDVHLTFSQPFEGIVSSKGQHGDPRCVYVPPSSGQTFFSFRIAYARCGTKPDLNGQFYENTVVVQYDKDLLEVWDEAKRLRCEWFNDYEKTASKPPMVIADLDVIQLDFRGDNVDCWMEIQHGKGPWAPPVSGIVPLGSTLTLVVAINDYRGEFDMRVKSCVASDGGGHVIQLSDEFGCVLRPKMISRFLKARGADERASVITYAFFHAFKFPDALSVHIKCKVEICRHGCLDHCQLQPNKPPALDTSYEHHPHPLERKDDKIASSEIKDRTQDVDQSLSEQDMLYDDIIHENEAAISSGENVPAIKMSINANMNQQNIRKQAWKKPASMQEQNSKENEKTERRPTKEKTKDEDSSLEDDNDLDMEEMEIHPISHQELFEINREKFPHGPRKLDIPMAVPRSLEDGNPVVLNTFAETKESTENTTATGNKQNKTEKRFLRETNRRQRSMVISDRKARSADVGVSSIYEVISEADLAFSPDNKAEAVTVFQGRIREEVVYGICMPVPGFSVLFVLVAVSAVVSALVAGTLLYRYQLQKEHLATQQQQQNGSIPMSIFSNWMGLKLLKPHVSTGHMPRSDSAISDQNGTMDTSLSINSSNGKTLCSQD